MKDNIVLIGFMGAGKDTVGKLLAEKTGRQFISTDDLVEAAEQQAIADIFHLQGEEYFRAKETMALQALAGLCNLVIACGGGAVIKDKNRRLMSELGRIVHLDADLPCLFKRTIHDRKRPLAKNRSRFGALYKERTGQYDFGACRIDTSRLNPAAVADRIMRKLGLTAGQKQTLISRLTVKAPSKRYDALIGGNILDKAVKSVAGSDRIMIISNPLVSSIYRRKLSWLSNRKNLKVFEHDVPDGEKHKNMHHVRQIYDRLLKNGFERSDMIIALGGGVISDLAGFIASTYKRGMKFVVMPTTLLAQVDAGIGGKTGVDMGVKNSIGTFYQPDLVIVDTAFIQTLSGRQYNNGIAEIIKYGATLDPELFSLLEEKIDRVRQRDPVIMNNIIRRCIAHKARIVEQDEREQAGIRTVLNFGHTIGHALERVSGYSIDHGAAVAVGMSMEAGFAKKTGAMPALDHRRLITLIANYGLPTGFFNGIKTSDIRAFISQDKKIRNSKLRLPILKRIGRTAIREVQWKRLW